MKVLWFSVTPSLYATNNVSHNGGGWIESLESIVKKKKEIELSIAFISTTNNDDFKVRKNRVTYYPINIRRNFFQKYYDQYTYKYTDRITLEACDSIIKDCNPDVIHIFGSEWCFGLIKERTKIPIVIHMQGCWPPYRNEMMPPGWSLCDSIISDFYNIKHILGLIMHNHLSRERAIREEKILRLNSNYMCRTRWDKSIVKLYRPDCNVFYCSEALRRNFMSENNKWVIHNRNKLVLSSVGSGSPLKGLDVILKTAKIIKENSDISFEWLLPGPSLSVMKMYERKVGVKCEDVNVRPLGRLLADSVRDTLLLSDIYIHPVYIDNSPNSVCEAQYLGLPIVATSVGGVPSLFDNDYPSDFLVPTNDPYYLASKIIQLWHDKELLKYMSVCNHRIAHIRHNDDGIYSNLLNAYNKVITK